MGVSKGPAAPRLGVLRMGEAWVGGQVNNMRARLGHAHHSG